MSLEYQRDSGLVVPVGGSDEAAIRAELKAHDSELVLLPPDAVVAGREEQDRRGYRVYRRTLGDAPLEFICFWGNDYGEPYPLSSGLVDEVKRLDRNTQSRYLDDLARNELRRQAIAKDNETKNEALADDWNPKHGRPLLPRSQSLRMARDKRRARGEKV